MSKIYYIINETWEGDDGEEIAFNGIIEIDDVVIKSVDEYWRSFFYNLTTPQEIAEHIAYNIIVNNATLSRLDGFADMDDKYARIFK
jgi:hypothetical protein